LLVSFVVAADTHLFHTSQAEAEVGGALAVASVKPGEQDQDR
jgi:hypothetical protein